MEFADDAHRAAYERVKDYMVQLYGEESRALADSPDFVLSRGSAEVNVNVSSMPEGLVIAIYSWVVTGVEPSIDLYRHLLEENVSSLFGAYGVGDDNRVLFRHVVSGESVDKDGLRAAVKAVSDVADGADEQLVSRFSGKRAVDNAGTAA